jgi:hypothetical protein
VSEDHGFFMFGVKQSKKTAGLLDPKDVGNCSSNNTASHPGRLLSVALLL